MICVFPGLRLAGHSRKSAFLIGWSGMRGVLALAAAFSLPDNFPQHNMIVFLTFCVIFTTLVLQGLSMPLLIERLGLAGVATDQHELENARRHMTEQALDTLAKMRTEWGGRDLDVLNQAENFYRSRLTKEDLGPLAREETRLLRRIKKQLREAERGAAHRMRDEGRIDDALLRALEYEIDLRDATEEG
jgi:CPA1 family monovalent cation:H+ antiporter